MNKKNIQFCIVFLLIAGFLLIMSHGTVSAAPWANQDAVTQRGIHMVTKPRLVSGVSGGYKTANYFSGLSYGFSAFAPTVPYGVGTAVFGKKADGTVTWNGCFTPVTRSFALVAVNPCNPCRTYTCSPCRAFSLRPMKVSGCSTCTPWFGFSYSVKP